MEFESSFEIVLARECALIPRLECYSLFTVLAGRSCDNENDIEHTREFRFLPRRSLMVGYDVFRSSYRSVFARINLANEAGMLIRNVGNQLLLYSEQRTRRVKTSQWNISCLKYEFVICLSFIKGDYNVVGYLLYSSRRSCNMSL
jgi:hypothetical protein